MSKQPNKQWIKQTKQKNNEKKFNNLNGQGDNKCKIRNIMG